MQIRHIRAWRLGLCFTGAALFVAALLLPGIRLENGSTINGAALFVAGFYWYPSNLALILSPLISTVNRFLLRAIVGAFLFLSGFCTAAFCPAEIFAAHCWPMIAFWLWTAALMISGLSVMGSVVPSRPSASLAEGRQPSRSDPSRPA
jgi:hypothetical protein